MVLLNLKNNCRKENTRANFIGQLRKKKREIDGENKVENTNVFNSNFSIQIKKQ